MSDPPGRAGGAWALTALWAAPSVAVLCALAALVIDRPGYSPDEEITAVIATSIGSSGMPLLPSGVLYNRGVPYLYFAWLTGALLGPSMLAWRAASLLCAAAGLAMAFRLGRTLGGSVFGVLLTLLLASCPPFVAASVFARQYSALVAAALLFIWLFTRWAVERRRPWPALFALAVVALLHPLGIALAGLPIVYVALDSAVGRASAVRFALAAGAVVSLVSLASYGAHFISLQVAGVSVSADTAIYAVPTPALPALYVVSLATYRSWIAGVIVLGLLGYVMHRSSPGNSALIIGCVICALGFQLGVMLLAGVIATVMKPDEVRRWLFCVVPLAIASVVWWSMHTAVVTDVQLSVGLALGLARAASSYPLSYALFALGAFPVMTTLVVLGCAEAMARPESVASRTIRGLVVLTLSLLAAFAVASVPVTERYLLLPWTFLSIVAVSGIAAGAGLLGRQRVSPAILRVAIPVFVAAAGGGLLEGHYLYARARETLVAVPLAQRALAPATGPSWTPERLSSLLAPGDTVVCTEELACRYLVGRLDYLFALPPADVAHYVVSRGGSPVGFYAGAPVISSGPRLEELIVGDSSHCVVVVTLRTGKVGFEEYNTVVAATGARFESRVLLANDETRVIRICGFSRQ